VLPRHDLRHSEGVNPPSGIVLGILYLVAADLRRHPASGSPRGAHGAAIASIPNLEEARPEAQRDFRHVHVTHVSRLITTRMVYLYVYYLYSGYPPPDISAAPL